MTDIAKKEKDSFKFMARLLESLIITMLINHVGYFLYCTSTTISQ